MERAQSAVGTKGAFRHHMINRRRWGPALYAVWRVRIRSAAGQRHRMRIGVCLLLHDGSVWVVIDQLHTTTRPHEKRQRCERTRTCRVMTALPACGASCRRRGPSSRGGRGRRRGRGKAAAYALSAEQHRIVRLGARAIGDGVCSDVVVDFPAWWRGTRARRARHTAERSAGAAAAGSKGGCGSRPTSSCASSPDTWRSPSED